MRLSVAMVLLTLTPLAGGCATKAIRAHAGVMAVAGERLSAEVTAFTDARGAMVRSRHRSLVERQQEIAEQGRYNARTLAQWRVAGGAEHTRRLALFEAVVSASDAMDTTRDQAAIGEELVLESRSALGLDSAALHALVRSLGNLRRPHRWIDRVEFFGVFGAQVSRQVDVGLVEVRTGLDAARKAARESPVAQDSIGPPEGSPVSPGPGPESELRDGRSIFDWPPKRPEVSAASTAQPETAPQAAPGAPPAPQPAPQSGPTPSPTPKLGPAKRSSWRKRRLQGR